MGRHAFVSYARADKSFTSWLAGELEKRGVWLWADEERMPATASNRNIDEGIARSWHFVLVLPRHSLDSPQIIRELDVASGLRRPIVPVRIADVDGNRVPPEVSSRYYLDMTSTLSCWLVRSREERGLGLAISTRGTPKIHLEVRNLGANPRNSTWEKHCGGLHEVPVAALVRIRHAQVVENCVDGDSLQNSNSDRRR